MKSKLINLIIYIHETNCSDSLSSAKLQLSAKTYSNYYIDIIIMSM